MSFVFIVVALSLNLLLAESCPDAAQLITCNDNLAALNELYGEDFAANTTVCVHLQPNSTETLSYVDTPLHFNVVVLGNGGNVRCEERPNNTDVDDLLSYTHFPLRFHNASRVMITETHFHDCKRPLQFEWVQSIVISSSSFTNFQPGGAVEIYNSPLVCIEDSSFSGGTSKGLSNRSFTGNAGGVALGYNNTGHLHDTRPEVLISNCTFFGNGATAGEQLRFVSVIEVLSRRVYNQRGGGMAFYFGEDDYRGTIRVQHCNITNNVAEDSGGGIYMFLGGEDSFQNVTIYNTTFTGNSAIEGGGLEITHANARSTEKPNRISIAKCTFNKNYGNFGGGYKTVQLDESTNFNYMHIEDTVFDDNEAGAGAGVYLQSVISERSVTLLNRFTLENCNFTGNRGKRGVFFIIGTVVSIKGNTRLEGSVGPALRILGTLVVLEGNVLFRDNRNYPDGISGALHLSAFGQIVLRSGTNLTFLNNTGREGACIVVRGQLIAAAFTRQLYNPQCFLQYEDPTKPPAQWKVTMEFHGNHANVGPVVFLSSGATLCLWGYSTSPFFSDDLQSNWSFMNMSDNFVNGVDREDQYIQTGIVKLNLTTDYKSAYAGERIKLDTVALDFFGHNTSAFIGISSNSSSIVFRPIILPVNSSNGMIEFQFRDTTDDVNTTVELNPFFIPEQDPASFTLHHDPCLPGHKKESGDVCKCHEISEVILCREDFLLLANGLWGAPSGWSRDLVTYPCPPGYCYCNGAINNTDLREGCQLHFSQPEAICVSNRRRNDSNVLCGRCIEGHGVGLLTNSCKRHGNSIPDYYWLLPIYGIALVVSLVLLVKLGVHFPTLLRGFLFYIQITPIAVAYFPDIFTASNEVVSCIAAALALYVPYDFTFHEGMTSLEAYGLRYLAPLAALIVVPIAARVRRLRFKSWHGIWTIILLMYVMTIDTSASLLFCPRLSSQSRDPTVRWFFDGTIVCYTHWHIPLAILALVSLLALFLLIIFVAASIYFKTLRKKYVKFEQLEKFSIVITCGIKEEYKWWPVLELGCRYIFVTTVILNPAHVVLPLILSTSLFVLQSSIHPYRNKIANYVESSLLLWLVCLLALGNTTALQKNIRSRSNDTALQDGGGGHRWPDALIYIPVAVGAIVLLVHSVLLARKVILPHKEEFKRKLKMKTKKSVDALRHYTVSYSVRKRNDISITKTIVSLDDGDSDSL